QNTVKLIDMYMYNTISEIEFIILNPIIINALELDAGYENVSSYLKKFVEAKDFLKVAILVNKEGVNVASSEEKFVGERNKGKDWFEKAAQAKQTIFSYFEIKSENSATINIQ
ncbi:MAG TPA: hypothetical protein PLM75_11675, partial [bacterium]|nr:hypothetical protein [bacterium]